MVRKAGLEPARGYPLEPKSSASTSSATFAHCDDTAPCENLALDELVGRVGFEPTTY